MFKLELKPGLRQEFRITIPDRYPPRTPGHSDTSAREGYHIKAGNLTKVLEKFMEDHKVFEVDVDTHSKGGKRYVQRYRKTNHGVEFVTNWSFKED